MQRSKNSTGRAQPAGSWRESSRCGAEGAREPTRAAVPALPGWLGSRSWEDGGERAGGFVSAGGVARVLLPWVQGGCVRCCLRFLSPGSSHESRVGSSGAKRRPSWRSFVTKSVDEGRGGALGCVPPTRSRGERGEEGHPSLTRRVTQSSAGSETAESDSAAPRSELPAGRRWQLGGMRSTTSRGDSACPRGRAGAGQVPAGREQRAKPLRWSCLPSRASPASSLETVSASCSP